MRSVRGVRSASSVVKYNNLRPIAGPGRGSRRAPGGSRNHTSTRVLAQSKAPRRYRGRYFRANNYLLHIFFLQFFFHDDFITKENKHTHGGGFLNIFILRLGRA